MTITVDASAVIAVAADEPTKPALIEASRGADLIAPASLPLEVGNALSAMLKRGRITLPQAQAVLTAYEQIPIRLLSVDVSRGLELAHRLDLYTYDAYVLACAMHTDTPLLSLDGGQKAAAGRVGITVLELNA